MGSSHSIDIQINTIGGLNNLVGITTTCKYKLAGGNVICLEWKRCKDFIDFLDMIDSQKPYQKGFYIFDLGIEMSDPKEAIITVYIKGNEAINLAELREYIHTALN